jgi:hypothetical protein
MTNKKRTTVDKKDEGGKVKFEGFLQLKLTPEEKSYVANNPIKPEFYGQLASDLACEGYKVSLSFSPGQDSYILTAYGNRTNHPDAGWALSIWHRDFGRCFDILAFVVEEKGKAGSLTAWLGKEDDLDW